MYGTQTRFDARGPRNALREAEALQFLRAFSGRGRKSPHPATIVLREAARRQVDAQTGSERLFEDADAKWARDGAGRVIEDDEWTLIRAYETMQARCATDN